MPNDSDRATESPARCSPRRDPLATGFALLILAGALYALGELRDLFLLAFFAVLVATVLSFPVDWLSRRLPRGAAVGLTLTALVGLSMAAVGQAAPVVSEQASQLAEEAPAALAQGARWWSRLAGGAVTPGGLGEALRAGATRGVESVVPRALPLASDALKAVLAGVLVLVLALFLVHGAGAHREGLRALVPRRHEATLDELLRRLGATLRAWTGGIAVSMSIVGTLTGLGLAAAGVHGWLTLGLLAFGGAFVPYAGAMVTAVPGLLVALGQSPVRFLYALAVYLGVHVAEGYLVQPVVMTRAVRLHPATLLLWGLMMARLFGLPGVVVATPLLACVEVAVGYLYSERALGKRPFPL